MIVCFVSHIVDRQTRLCQGIQDKRTMSLEDDSSPIPPLTNLDLRSYIHHLGRYLKIYSTELTYISWNVLTVGIFNERERNFEFYGLLSEN